MKEIPLISEIFKVSEAVKPRNKYEVLAAFMEELGELSTEINIQAGFSSKTPGEDGIVGEAIDVILCAVDIIYLENPNITAEEFMNNVRKKLDKWKTKKQV